MRQSIARYYFSRLNIVYIDTNLFNRELSKPQLLEAALRSGTKYDFSGYQWGFFEVDLIAGPRGDYLTGILAKYRLIDRMQVADVYTQEIDELEVANEIKASVRFFLHLRSGLLIHKSKSPDISNQIFQNRFLDIFHKVFGRDVRAEISAIDERNSLLDEFRSFEKIDKITLCLVPSNPNLSDMWGDIDQDLKARDIAKLQEQYTIRSDRDGRALREDPRILAKIAMAEDGYGTAEVKGIKNGIKVSRSTKDLPFFAEVWEADDPSGRILENLGDKIAEFFSRFIE
ncbi:MAG: hypothetical protein ABIY70_25900 [Capsulimonas sp.]|uniref:hypothetical protein n=1 Tax=Capsulimonas sp. TaxID=2494211 RepID=UPI0032641C1B